MSERVTAEPLLCRMEPDGPEHFRCARCGWRWRDRHAQGFPPRKSCGTAPAPKPPPRPRSAARRWVETRPSVEDRADAERLGYTLADFGRWWQAVARWREAGRPTRTDDEVARLLEICQACTYYAPEGRCRDCGCRVNSGGRWLPITNKLRLGTERCRRGRW